MSWFRILVATVGFGGALLFGAAFVASYARPAFVEALAANVIRAEVEDRVRERVTALEGSPLAGIAAVVAQRNAEEIARVRRRLADTLHAEVARIAAEMRDPECECRGAVAGMAAGLDDWRGLVLSQASERLTALIRLKYMEVSAGLTREFRIFTAANALVLLFLGFAVVVRRNARLHLLPPAALLVCSAFVVGWFYLFEQDWLHTILFNDYVGVWYFAWVGAAFLFVCDVMFNRARVTAQLLNVGGSTVSALPC